jgi:hypothetical protein
MDIGRFFGFLFEVQQYAVKMVLDLLGTELRGCDEGIPRQMLQALSGITVADDTYQ